VIDETAVRSGLEEVQALVRADGGDMLLTSIDGSTVRLELVLEGANCVECVMPREILEQIALDVVQRRAPDVTTLHVDDPREKPGFVPPEH
jgi:Fe-S cluster biogenesis protein NfuA